MGNRAVAQLLNRAAANPTGLPDQLKSGIETLSGLSLDDVRVHYNSPRPAALDALAYAKGTDIHLAPGQERHLPHEAWHVVQQAQGRVTPTFQLNGEEISDDQSLEHEADVMGAKSMRMRSDDATAIRTFEQRDRAGVPGLGVAQLMVIPEKPKNYPEKAHAKDTKGQAAWQAYKNYDDFCNRVIAHNQLNKTTANANDLWKKANTVKDADAALKKFRPPEAKEPKPEFKFEPIEVKKVEPVVPDAVNINPAAYNHAADGWAGVMMRKGPVVVTNDEIKQYINDFIITHGFLSKATPNKTRARPWPDDKRQENGANPPAMCTIAYEWREATKRWDVFHFGPNGEGRSRDAIFDKFQ